MTLQELIVKVGADVSGYVSGIDAAISKGQQAEASFTSIGTTLSATLTVPLTAIGGAALQAASDLKEASNTMRVETGATGTALAGLNDSFKTVFAEVPTSAKAAGEAIATLSVRLGLAGQPLEALSTQLLELAHITHSDVQPLVETTAKLFQEWQVATIQQGDALDYLFKVSQHSGVGIQMLSAQLTEFGPTLKNLGFSLRDAALLLGQLDKAGVDASSVMPGLRKEFASLAKAGIDGADAFNKIVAGIQNGSVSLKQALEIFGAKSGGAIFRDVIEGKFGLNDLKAAVNSSTDTIAKATADTRTLSDEMARSWHQVEIALQPLGDVIKSAFKAGFEEVKPLIGVIQDLGQQFKALPSTTQNTIVAIGAIAAAAGPAALAIAGISAAVSTIGPAVAAAAPALGIIAFAVAALHFSGAIDEMIRFGTVAKTSFSELEYALAPTTKEIHDLENALMDLAKAAGFADASRAAQAFLSDLVSLKTAGQVLLQAVAPWATATHDAMKLVSDQLESIVALMEYITGRYKGMEDVARGLASTLTGITNQSTGAPDSLKYPTSTAKPGTSGSTGGIDLSGVGASAAKAVLSLDQLVKKQAELEAAARRAQSVFDSLSATFGDNAAKSDLVTKAEEQLVKALKDSGNTVGELAASLDLHNRTAAAAQAVLDQLRAKYEAGTISINLLAEAHKFLDQEIAKANGGIASAAQIEQGLIDKHVILVAQAANATQAMELLRQKYGNTKDGALLLADAHRALDAAMTAANGGVQTAAQIQQQLVDKYAIAKLEATEAAKAYMNMATQFGAASPLVQQALDLAVQKMNAVHMSAESLAPAVGGYTKEVTTASAATAALASNNQTSIQRLAAALDGAGNSAGGLRDNMRDTTTRTQEAAGAAGQLKDGLHGAEQPAYNLQNSCEATTAWLLQEARATGMISDGLGAAVSNMSSLAGQAKAFAQSMYDAATKTSLLAGTMLAGAGTNVTGQLGLFDPFHPEKGGYTVSNPPGGPAVVKYIEPSTGQNSDVKGHYDHTGRWIPDATGTTTSTPSTPAVVTSPTPAAPTPTPSTPAATTVDLSGIIADLEASLRGFVVGIDNVTVPVGHVTDDLTDLSTTAATVQSGFAQVAQAVEATATTIDNLQTVSASFTTVVKAATDALAAQQDIYQSTDEYNQNLQSIDWGGPNVKKLAAAPYHITADQYPTSSPLSQYVVPGDMGGSVVNVYVGSVRNRSDADYLVQALQQNGLR